MNSRLLVVGIVLTCILMLVGGGLIAGGVYFFNRLAPAQVVSQASSNDAPLQSAPQVGARAPDFTLNNLDQQTVQLSQLRGKAVMINFWATWCGPCSAEMQNIQSAYDKVGDSNLVVLAVNQGEFADQVRGYA